MDLGRGKGRGGIGEVESGEKCEVRVKKPCRMTGEKDVRASPSTASQLPSSSSCRVPSSWPYSSERRIKAKDGRKERVPDDDGVATQRDEDGGAGADSSTEAIALLEPKAQRCVRTRGQEKGKRGCRRNSSYREEVKTGSHFSFSVSSARRLPSFALRTAFLP